MNSIQFKLIRFDKKNKIKSTKKKKKKQYEKYWQLFQHP